MIYTTVLAVEAGICEEFMVRCLPAEEFSPETAAAGPIFFVATQLAMSLFWLCVAMFLIRKSKWEEIKANFTK